MEIVTKIVNLYHEFFVYSASFIGKLINDKIRSTREINKIVLYYRICNEGRRKDKPDFITKENCLRNAVIAFPLDKVEWHLVADNINEENLQMILKYIPMEMIRKVSVGSGAGTFRLVLEDAIKLSDNDLVYFLEDDYLHTPDALQYLIAAAEKNDADYYTLYDAPDKYGPNSPNHFVHRSGEKTRLMWCKGRHWKYTNSTTMTFAAYADVLRRDRNTFWRWSDKYLPKDFHIFTDLRIFKGARLMSPIPSLSTHGDEGSIAFGVDWAKV